MYHRVVSQKSALKVENSINEKRIQKKEERIANLEKRLTDMRDQNNLYKIELDKLKYKMQSESTRRISMGIIESEHQEQPQSQVAEHINTSMNKSNNL